MSCICVFHYLCHFNYFSVNRAMTSPPLFMFYDSSIVLYTSETFWWILLSRFILISKVYQTVVKKDIHIQIYKTILSRMFLTVHFGVIYLNTVFLYIDDKMACNTFFYKIKTRPITSCFYFIVHLGTTYIVGVQTISKIYYQKKGKLQHSPLKYTL